MAYEKKDMSGSLFANKKKTRDSDPNAKGDCLIDGVEYWISAWTNTAKSSGERYQALKFTRKDAPSNQAMRMKADNLMDAVKSMAAKPSVPAEPAIGPDHFREDEIPF